MIIICGCGVVFRVLCSGLVMLCVIMLVINNVLVCWGEVISCVLNCFVLYIGLKVFEIFILYLLYEFVLICWICSEFCILVGGLVIVVGKGVVGLIIWLIWKILVI